jgi:predicted transcriptional regulator
LGFAKFKAGGLYKMPTACKLLVEFVRNHDLEEIPPHLIKKFRELVGRI